MSFNTPRRIPAALLILALGLGAAPAEPRDGPAEADGRGYEIKLSRVPKVGAKYDYSAEGAVLQQATFIVGGEKRRKTEGGYGVRLEGVVEVLAVNGLGEETKVACTVKQCVRVNREGEQPLVPEGRVVTATAGESDTSFAVDEGELSAEAKEALELVLRLPDDDGSNDDDIFGTKERKKVGEAWPINPKPLVKDAADDGVTVDEKDVTGSIKVEGVETAGGVECLKLAASMGMKQFVGKTPEGLPEGMKAEGGSMEARYSGLFPVDTSVPSLSESMSVTFLTTIKGRPSPDAPETTIESKVQRAVESKRTFR